MARLAASALVLVALAVTAQPAGAGHQADRASALEVYGGVGSWLDIFVGSAWSRPDAVTAAARDDGVGTIYLQTSNYSQPAAIVRPAALGRFLDAAHSAGLRVVGWYLPGFASPGLDAQRALAAIRFRSASGQRFDGFALDIEASVVSSVELRNVRLLALARLLRRSVPTAYPLGAIIPSPVGMQRHPRYWPGFPYRGLARWFDAFLPMAYFSYHAHTRSAVYAYARDVVAEIRARTGNPHELIHVIGGIATGLTQPALTGFVEAVSDCGAQGISLYAFPETSHQEWTDLTSAVLGGPATADCRR